MCATRLIPNICSAVLIRLDAQRILKRLEEEHVPFSVEDCSEVRPDSTRYRRRSLLCIYIRREHQEQAEAIVLEDVQP
jgi:hypothetical protein